RHAHRSWRRPTLAAHHPRGRAQPCRARRAGDRLGGPMSDLPAGDPVADPPRPHAPRTSLPRRTLVTETVLVLGVSLGASAVWALLSILRKVTAETPLSSQTTAMNTSVTPDRPWLDLVHQL